MIPIRRSIARLLLLGRKLDGLSRLAARRGATISGWTQTARPAVAGISAVPAFQASMSIKLGEPATWPPGVSASQSVPRAFESNCCPPIWWS